MKNYTKTNVGTAARTELHDALSLTGEIGRAHV